MNTMTRENDIRELAIDELDAVAGGDCNGIQVGDRCFLEIAPILPTATDIAKTVISALF